MVFCYDYSMKLFVWDFHGVLEKDNDIATLEISNKVLEKFGFKERFSSEDNRNYYGLKWYQYFERLLPNITNKEHLALQSACFKYAEENLHILTNNIKPNDNSILVLKAIQQARHDQIILSNTRPSDLLWFVNTVGMSKYFPNDKIFGVNAHQKHGAKKDALEHYLRSKAFDQIVIIGDSKSDMKLQEVAGGITYFYNHPHINHLEMVKADHIVKDLRKVLQEL